MPNVFLMSGRTGAGKTTASKILAQKLPAFRISHDEWLNTAYGDGIDNDRFDDQCDRINRMIWKQVELLVQLDIHVVLEGWGGRALRDAARKELNRLQVNYKFLYIECAREVRWDRVRQRNTKLNGECFEITREAFDRMEHVCEGLDADEEGIVIHNPDALGKPVNLIHALSELCA